MISLRPLNVTQLEVNLKTVIVTSHTRFSSHVMGLLREAASLINNRIPVLITYVLVVE